MVRLSFCRFQRVSLDYSWEAATVSEAAFEMVFGPNQIQNISGHIKPVSNSPAFMSGDFIGVELGFRDRQEMNC